MNEQPTPKETVYHQEQRQVVITMEYYRRARQCVNALAGVADPAAELARLRHEITALQKTIYVDEGIRQVLETQLTESEAGAAALREALEKLGPWLSASLEEKACVEYRSAAEGGLNALATNAGRDTLAELETLRNALKELMECRPVALQELTTLRIRLGS